MPLSLPVQGAWIEMVISGEHSRIILSLPVQGAWIEIDKSIFDGIRLPGRSPCRERGLK